MSAPDGCLHCGQPIGKIGTPPHTVWAHQLGNGHWRITCGGPGDLRMGHAEPVPHRQDGAS